MTGDVYNIFTSYVFTQDATESFYFPYLASSPFRAQLLKIMLISIPSSPTYPNISTMYIVFAATVVVIFLYQHRVISNMQRSFDRLAALNMCMLASIMAEFGTISLAVASAR
jgi:hypothetical protein